MKVVIHWFRHDLRIADNVALAEACRQGERVLPVYIIEDTLRTDEMAGPARLAYMLDALAELSENLKRQGSSLVIRHGRAEEILPKLCREVQAEAVFCNRQYEPQAQQRDAKVARALSEHGVAFESFKDAVIWEDREVLTKTGNSFTVFTPYSKAWKSKPMPVPLPKLAIKPAPAKAVTLDPLPRDPADLGHPLTQTRWPAGETVAGQAVDRFLDSDLFQYAQERNLPAHDRTSKWSAHLHCGTIGIRTVMARLAAAAAKATPAQRESCDVFMSELIWREFFLQILANHSYVVQGCLRRTYDALRWSEDTSHFEAWCAGRTGYPIVDAAMRCLNKTGFMHNRLRMVTAMFLVKDLRISWQWGERYFMRQLVDGDLALNNGNWQWCAGTGADAAPYFRIFNPVSQGEKFDPDGTFVRKWIPELANVRGESIHSPWKDPVFRGGKYPSRIVIHEEERPKTLALYRQVKAPFA